MIRNRQSFLQLNKYIAGAIFALMLMIAGSVGQQPDQVAAAGCNTVLTDFSLPGWPKAYYYDPTFYEGKCTDGSRAFPNTGAPYSADGNVDSVGYAIPRTYKSSDYNSEALANVNTKDEFYNKLRSHYFDRVVPGTQEGYWAKDGAAFVVFTFIGKAPPADRNLTNADWAAFKQRLDNPSLTMSIDDNHTLSPNSGSVYDTAGRLDFVHFYDEMGLKGPALVFKINGVEVASIERKCANLLGTVALPQPNLWTTSAVSRVGVDYTPPNVSSWTASPNQMLYWRHTISAAGGTTPGLGFAVGKSGFNGADVWGTGLPANHNEPTGTTPGMAAGSSYSVGWGANRPEYSEYRVLPSDGGRTLCQGISWGPTAWDDATWTASTPACVTVPYNYNLTPSVAGSNASASIGASIPQVRASVNNQLPGNASQTTISDSVEWQLKRIHVPPTGSIDMTLRESGNDPCVHYANTICLDKGSGTRTFDPGDTLVATLDNEGVDPADSSLQVGTKICYTLSVRPYSQSNGNWRHGVPVCITVSKQPKVQVWGNDLRTRGSIKTGTALLDDAGSEKVFGSWVEYGGFSVGANEGFASGSGLNNGNTNTAPSEWHKLTFANVDDDESSSFGKYTLGTLPNLTDQFIGAPSGGVFNSNLGALSSGTYPVGGVTIDTSAVEPGKSIIIVSSGVVEITGDITYLGTSGDQFTDLRQIPQVVIIAPTINIAEDVTRIDAWLLTTSSAGKINTCYRPGKTETSALNSTVCNKVLTVNGPVVTQHLHLRRTAGADNLATAGAPAEVFNLRPDAYIWAYARANQSGKAQTVYSIELPPRF